MKTWLFFKLVRITKRLTWWAWQYETVQIKDLKRALKQMESCHAGDCTIYRAVMNGSPTDGICTCGYGWSVVRRANWSEMYSEERLKKTVDGKE